MSYDLLTDEMLVKLLHASDEGAYKTIFEKYWKKMYLTAHKKVRSHALAEEITQQVFVNIWEKRTRLVILNIEAYLNSAIKYGCINYFESRYAKIMDANKELKEHLSDYTADDALHSSELHLAIDKAINILPPKTKEVFKLSRFDHFTVREIAQKMNISEKAVEYHVTQSLKMMRCELKEHLFFGSFFGALISCYFL